MAFDLGSARHWAAELQSRAAFPGAVAVDATMGNGGDTQSLCEWVGAQGRVYAFDVQPQALKRTRERLLSAGVEPRARLILDSHENIGRYVCEKADLAVFNLGWLPGAGKQITTRLDSTLRALDACLTLMRTGALLTVCAYPGHEEGERELQGAIAWARALPGSDYHAMVRAYLNQPNAAPVLLAVQKRC